MSLVLLCLLINMNLFKHNIVLDHLHQFLGCVCRCYTSIQMDYLDYDLDTVYLLGHNVLELLPFVHRVHLVKG